MRSKATCYHLTFKFLHKMKYVALAHIYNLARSGYLIFYISDFHSYYFLLVTRPTMGSKCQIFVNLIARIIFIIMCKVC